MKQENAFSLKTLVACFLIVGAMAVTFYFAAVHVFQGMSHHLGPLIGEPQKLPEEASEALSNLEAYISHIRDLLIPSVFGLGGLAALVLWVVVEVLGRRAMRSPTLPQAEVHETARPSPSSPSAAIYILSILQRRGRLIDFLQEDLSMYSDEQVGAAVRNIHQGCKEALVELVDVKPIVKEEEGAEVTIQPGFDAHSVRLTGNVVGDPPFKGILRHHGWRVVRLDLPQRILEQEKEWVVDPAEVEVNP
jgi:hypothetical protein